MPQAAIYCRISRDPEGERAGVERQEEDARALAVRRGHEVVAVYIDNDVSASTLSRKPRPQYAAMLDAARDGGFSVILAYSNSRLTRRLRELEDLLELHDRHGVTVETVVSGNDDLSTADGRMTARIKASVDAGEAERAGERIARAHLQRARSGSVNHGGRPFGWNADKVSLHPTEGTLIRKAVSELLDGVGLREIARQWNVDGVTTARGGVWDHRAIRQLLKGPRLAGWRVHRGRIATDINGDPVRGVWEPIMDNLEWERLQVALSGRHGRSTGRRGARKYLLSGLARCGLCGGRMYGTPTKQGHAYVCRGDVGNEEHTVSVAGEGADTTVSEVVVARLRLVECELTSPTTTPLDEDIQLEAITTKIKELMTAYSTGQLSATIVFPQVERLEAEQSELKFARARLVAATAGPGRVDVETFENADVSRQRAIVEELLEAVVVAPSRKGARWDPDRITYVWRQS